MCVCVCVCVCVKMTLVTCGNKIDVVEFTIILYISPLHGNNYTTTIKTFGIWLDDCRFPSRLHHSNFNIPLNRSV